MKAKETVITEELIEQTYLFCYKRLQNPEDAQDLAQEILCEALRVLATGRTIHHFHSWYWKMAKNRYAVMLNRRNQKPAIYPIDDLMEELIWEAKEAIEQIVLEEELSHMHAVIAHLSAIHREILVHYYLKGQSIHEIAKRLEIPEGTVKRRLFDAKQEAKKGMEDMTKVTELSYAPQELELWFSRGLAEQEVFQDLMGKQILTACYAQPKTVMALSEELQIAPVYVEDKINRMLNVSVLKPMGKQKYHTAFPIFSKNVVTKMLQEVEEIHMKMCETAYSAVQNHWKEIKESGFYGTHLPENYLNMVFLFLSINCLGGCCVDAYHKSKQWKDYGPAESDFFDYESVRIMGQILPADETLSDYEVKALEWRFLDQRIETVSGNIFAVYDCFVAEPFPEDRILRLHGNNIEFLCELSQNPGKSLSKQEEILLSNLLENGLAEKRKDGYYPTVVIFESKQVKYLLKLFREQILPVAEKYASQLAEKIDKYLLPEVRGDLLEQYYNYVVNIFLMPTSNMMWWAKTKHLFAEPKDPDRSGQGMYIVTDTGPQMSAKEILS